MSIVDIFSKRQKRLRGEAPDVYSYDELPSSFRVQVVHIWRDALGGGDNYREGQVERAYKIIVETLCREYGVFVLPHTRAGGRREYIDELVDFFLNETDVEHVLDALELSFRVIDRLTRSWDYLHRQSSDQVATAAIDELNSRLRETGIGYQYSDGEILRVDSEFVHAEVVKPALQLLNQKGFVGAQEEFLKAHEHYRKGNSKEALNESLKSLESLMKAICDRRGWHYSGNATAKTLVQVCFDKGLIPDYWQNSFGALRGLLEGGVPTGRNKLSAHGQGANRTDVPDYTAAYVLHMTAAAIVFLAEADAALH